MHSRLTYNKVSSLTAYFLLVYSRMKRSRLA